VIYILFSLWVECPFPIAIYLRLANRKLRNTYV
jgi:hypothetical protein